MGQTPGMTSTTAGTTLEAQPKVPPYAIAPSKAGWWERTSTRFSGWLMNRWMRRFARWFAPSLAFWISQTPMVFAVVATLVRFRIFDRLQNGPLSSAELAILTDSNEQALLRVLRPAAQLAILDRLPDGRYALSPLGRQFCQDAPQPAAAWTELMDRMVLETLPQLPDAIRAGDSLVHHVHGMTCWERMAEVPGTNELHDIACGRWTELVVDRVAQSYDFTKAQLLIDVGGGRGALLSAILKSAPHLRGIVYDRNETKAAAQAMFERQGVADRACHNTGNFFAEVPEGADLYTIKHVLHDWDDDSVVRILSNIRAALTDSAKLLIIEGSVDHDLGPMEPVRAIWDLSQFATTWGKSRTLDDFAKIAQAAGLRLKTVFPTQTIDTLILECVPA